MVETRGGRRFALFFVAAAFVVLLASHWLTPVDNVATTAAAPFTSLISGIAQDVGDTLSGVFQAGELRRENAALRQRYASLLKIVISLKARAHDNALYKTMLRFADSSPHLDLLPARVIWTDPTGIGNDIVIDKGAQDGLRDQMTVLDPNGWFVGTIEQVRQNNAVVTLLENPSLSVGAYDLTTGAGGMGALVEGRYDALPQLRYVLTRDTLHVNDLVVTSGQLNLYPRNILLGQVVSVHRVPYQIWQDADIKPAADIAHLEVVQVVRNWNPAAAAQPPSGH
ncbi:MAG TPA: rod shape-determining protein MreC [Chloroflexota bacterium]|nr:rod shape-determining protein MreC [Chloroflexota bacterium]